MEDVKIPSIDYTLTEKQTWKMCYEKLEPLFNELACQDYLEC